MMILPVRTMILDLDPSTPVEEAEQLAGELHMDLSWNLKTMTDYIAVRRGDEDFPVKNRRGPVNRWMPMPQEATRV